MNIAILGAGNSGCALASDYAARGHEVTLIKTSHSLHDDNFTHLCATGGRMRIHDFGKETDCVIAHLSRDVADVRAKDVVLLCTQTGYHPDVLRRVVPFLTPGQVLLMVPGYLSTAYALVLLMVPGYLSTGGAARQRPAFFVRPADGAERRTEQDAEDAYRCAVQHFRQNARGGHRTTFFPAKEYSRYWSLTVVKRPWGSGTSARLSMVMLLAVMFWTYSILTR